MVPAAVAVVASVAVAVVVASVAVAVVAVVAVVAGMCRRGHVLRHWPMTLRIAYCVLRSLVIVETPLFKSILLIY